MCIALTGEEKTEEEELKLIIKDGICKFNEGVYNNLQILAVYGESWNSDSLNKFMMDEVRKKRITML